MGDESGLELTINRDFNATNFIIGNTTEVDLLGWLQHDGQDFSLNASIVTVLVIVCSICIWKRPRTLAAVIVCWIFWFIYALVEAVNKQGSVNDVLKMVGVSLGAVRESSRNLVLALFDFCKAWLLLVAPFLKLVWDTSKTIWDATPEKDKPMVALSVVGVLTVIWTASVVMRHAESIKTGVIAVLCQATFLIVGPAVYWLMERAPLNICPWVVFVFMDVIPTILSVSTMRSFTEERDRKRKDLHRIGDILRSGINPAGPDKLICQLADRLFLWLSYWSCWPFFFVANGIAFDNWIGVDLIHEDVRPRAYGVMVAVVVWASFWGACRIAPFIAFHLMRLLTCIPLFQSSKEAAVKAATEVAQAGQGLVVVSAAQSEWPGWINEHYTGVTAALMGFALLLVILTFFGEAFSFINSLVVGVLLVSVGMDSASRCTWKDVETASSRLGFWITAMLWLWFCRVPVLGKVLEKLSLMVLILAMFAGETSVYVLRRHCLW